MSILPKNIDDFDPDVKNIILKDRNLNEVVSKGLIYKKCTFINCNCIDDTNFESSVFIECTFRKLKSYGTNFSKNIFIKCKFINCNIENTIFTENNFNRTIFRGSSIRDCDFSGSGYFGVVFDSSTLNNLNFSDSYFDEKSIINYNSLIDNINLTKSTVNWNAHKWIECILQKYAITEEEKNLVRQISKDRDKCWGRLTDIRNKHIKKAFKSLAIWYKENDNKGHFVPNAIKNMAKNIEE